ncbi:hypothetical protein DFH08DRAFT_872786 [Mycena albidolilacea]|uniref:Uncharacterized protein n=1 Tax=Mycena albidolilacea TaxID=1033008 RepID=A0AAD7EQV0_9AGAR|nr:hypothetical protein DFH08DRAFT_872786 [Mycena albidolilacea]
MPKHIRCNHYDSDGSRVDPSLFHPDSCNFAHPDESAWWAAFPARVRLRPSPSKHSSSAYPRRDRHSRSRSPHRSPRATARRAPSMDSRDPRMESRDPRRRSVASSSPAPPKQPAFAPPPPLSAPPLSTPRPPLSVPPLSAPLPPPPLTIPLPPSLPASFATPDAPKPSTEGEMKVMWEKVLPHLAACVENRKAYQECQKEVAAYEHICNTPRYTTFGTDAERARVAQELASLRAARDEKSKALSRSVLALKDVAWWPVGPNQDEEAAAKYRELIQYVLQLNNAASELHQAYIKGAAQVAPVAAPPQPDPPQPDPNGRPLKRRRVSDAADDAQALSAADLAEMEQLRERLEELNERVGDLKNDLNVLETSDKDTIIAEIDARMEAFALETRSSGGGASSAELQTVEATVKTTNDHINVLAPEIANMLVEGQRCREENDALKREIEKQSAQFTAMQAQLDTLQEAMKADQAPLYALTVAFERLEEQRPPPPPSLPLDFILAAIDEPIRDTVQAVVRPMVEDMGRDLKEKISTQDAEMYGQLWGKIALTLQVVKAVSEVTPSHASSKGKSKSTTPAAVAPAVP